MIIIIILNLILYVSIRMRFFEPKWPRFRLLSLYSSYCGTWNGKWYSEVTDHVTLRHTFRAQIFRKWNDLCIRHTCLCEFLEIFSNVNFRPADAPTFSWIIGLMEKRSLYTFLTYSPNLYLYIFLRIIRNKIMQLRFRLTDRLFRMQRLRYDILWFI